QLAADGVADVHALGAVTSTDGFPSAWSTRRAIVGHGTPAGSTAPSSSTLSGLGGSSGFLRSSSDRTPLARRTSTSSCSSDWMPVAREAMRSNEACVNRLARSTCLSSSVSGSRSPSWVSSIAASSSAGLQYGLAHGLPRGGTIVPMLLAEIAETSAAVAGTSARLAKVEQLAAWLGRLTPAEV